MWRLIFFFRGHDINQDYIRYIRVAITGTILFQVVNKCCVNDMVCVCFLLLLFFSDVGFTSSFFGQDGSNLISDMVATTV